VEKYGGTRQATDDNIIRRMRFACWIIKATDIGSDFFFPVALRPNAGHDLLILEVSRSHTTTHHSR